MGAAKKEIIKRFLNRRGKKGCDSYDSQDWIGTDELVMGKKGRSLRWIKGRREFRRGKDREVTKREKKKEVKPRGKERWGR